MMQKSDTIYKVYWANDIGLKTKPNFIRTGSACTYSTLIKNTIKKRIVQILCY